MLRAKRQNPLPPVEGNARGCRNVAGLVAKAGRARAPNTEVGLAMANEVSQVSRWLARTKTEAGAGFRWAEMEGGCQSPVGSPAA